jgi:hypothetical protein
VRPRRGFETDQLVVLAAILKDNLFPIDSVMKSNCITGDGLPGRLDDRLPRLRD